jgi:hypothetical protein
MNFFSKPPIFAHLRTGMKEVVKCSQAIKGAKRAKTEPVNKLLWGKLYPELRTELDRQAVAEKWKVEKHLDALLRLFYCCLVVNLETRNKVVAYDYMDFARRIGELWENFCMVCWEAPVNQKLRRLESPTFKSVKGTLLRDFLELVKNVGKVGSAITKEYEKVIDLLGNINLTEDEYCAVAEKRYVIDFKSGFGSNEKGNTERLLTVAKIYRLLPGDHTCVLAVRSKEDEGNNYLQVLKSSGLWTVNCGADAYKFMQTLTGFDVAAWIGKNVSFHEDMETEAYRHLHAQGLTKYLTW